MREYGILRNRDLRELGVRTSDLFFLTFVGGLRHYGAGLYYESSVEPSATALVSRRVNNATLCLLSALYVHRVFAGEPERVWVAIPRSQRRPLPLVAPLEVIRVTKALHEGSPGNWRLRSTRADSAHATGRSDSATEA